MGHGVVLRRRRDLAHLDMCYQHVENGLDLEILTEDKRALTDVGQWNLYGFSHYVLQCVRGLAEGTAGPFYKRREGVRHVHDFFMDPMLGDQYKLTSELYPKHFPQINISRKREYGSEEFKNIPYYHEEGRVGDTRSAPQTGSIPK